MIERMHVSLTFSAQRVECTCEETPTAMVLLFSHHASYCILTPIRPMYCRSLCVRALCTGYAISSGAISCVVYLM